MFNCGFIHILKESAPPENLVFLAESHWAILYFEGDRYSQDGVRERQMGITSRQPRTPFSISDGNYDHV